MRRTLFSCALLAASGLATTAFGQMQGFGSGMGSSMGGFGSSGMGMSGMGGMGGMGSSMGGFGSSGMGGFGSSGMGGMGGFGSSGMGSMGSGMGMMGNMGGMNGMNSQGGAFIGRNTNQQQFLGRNAQVTGQGNNMMGNNQFGNNNRGGNRGLNTFNNMMTNANNFGGGGANANQAPPIRPRQRVAFEYSLPKAEAVQTKVSNHLTKLSTPAIGYKGPDRSGLKNVTIAMSGNGEAVLTGSVSSEAESKLAENLLRIEPGIRSIKNELTFPAPKEE